MGNAFGGDVRLCRRHSSRAWFFKHCKVGVGGARTREWQKERTAVVLLMNEEIQRTALQAAKRHVGEGRHDLALVALGAAFTGKTDFSLFARAAKWASSIRWPNLRPFSAVFLGGGSLEHLMEAVAFQMLLEGFDARLHLAPYGAWRQAVLSPVSLGNEAAPDVVWFFTHHRDIHLDSSPELSKERAREAVAAAVDELAGYWLRAHEVFPGATIFQNNMEMVEERVFGQLGARLPGGHAVLCRLFNVTLAERAGEMNVVLFDYAYEAAACGLSNWHDPRYWFHSKHPFAPEFVGNVSFSLARALAATKSSGRKVIVLDLDNTLWGGVVADDGLEGIRLGQGADGEAFAAFQSYLKSLAGRGVILAVSSKNEEALARQPFLEHPSMVLRLEDIAVFKANWNNKADSIREIAAILNLGLESFVFLDDSPAERALVRHELPMVATPDLPEDPAEYVPALDRLEYFESMSFSREDALRGQMYRENAARAEVRVAATNLDAYLRDLRMVADCGGVDAFTLPRMAQLINKSNQFHLTTTRYSEDQLLDFSRNPDVVVRWFSLRDRFGDSGLISVVIMFRRDDAYEIDTWVMSCRVLERGMEQFIVQELAQLAKEAGVPYLVGTYRPTAKNAMVANLYGRLGFSLEDSAASGECRWKLRVGPCFEGQSHQIKKTIKTTGWRDER